MNTPIHPTIKPISDYAAVLVEMEHWKEKFYDLQAQISELRQTGTDTVIIKEGGTARYIRLSDIIMMQADSNYTTIYLTDGDKILTSKTLKYWSEKIKSHAVFIRPHRSYLVNKTHILSYQTSTHRLLLAQGQEIHVSRRYKFL
jgi:DNA-binding LytR/AlgR family response regulator